MDDLKRSLNEAFRLLASDAVHPTAEEIAVALDEGGSAFAAAEVRAHLGWCDGCRAVGVEYESFRAPSAPVTGSDDAAWAAMRRRLPAETVRGSTAGWKWLPMAAALAIVMGPFATWQVMRGRSPVTIEKVVERVVEKPVDRSEAAVANLAVLDLFPVGSGTRSGGGAAASAIGTGPVLLILNGAPGDDVATRVRDGAGRELWSGRLRRQSGVFTLQLPASTLAGRPLKIECGVVQYLIP